MIIGVPVEFANPRILPIKLIRALCLPSLERAFARSPCPIVFHHGGNRLLEYLPLYADLPNVAVFAIDEHDPPAEARAALGAATVILAGPCGPRLNRTEPETLRRQMEGLLAAVRNDPRFILNTSAADVPWDTEAAVIDALMDAARAEVFHAGD
jgi:uroporphyrinogen decarboxylase